MNLKNCAWELKDYKWGRGHTSRPTLWTDDPGSQWGQESQQTKPIDRPLHRASEAPRPRYVLGEMLSSFILPF